MLGFKTLIGFPFLLLGLIFTGASLWFAQESIHIAWSGIETQGTVLRMERRYSHRRKSYHPHVEFTDRQGQQHYFSQSLGTLPTAYSAGEHVRVRYLPDTPERAIIDSFWGRYGELFSVALAQILVVVGALLIRSDRREMREIGL